MATSTRPGGMAVFTIVWLGQLVSMLGTSMALLLILCGVTCALVGIAGYAFGAVREVEHVLPDHDANVKVSAST